MKKLLLTLILLFSILGMYAQSCITVISSSFTNPSGDDSTWRLTINYTANGVKNLKTYVFVDGDTVINACFQTSQGTSNGSISYDGIIAPGGLLTLTAKFVRRTGTCDNGTSCDGDQVVINNTLDLKIANIYARNIGNITEITFKILSVDQNSRIIFNFYMPDGKIKKREIKLPNARNGQIWRILYNNITDTYTTNKL